MDWLCLNGRAKLESGNRRAEGARMGIASTSEENCRIFRTVSQLVTA